MGRKTNRSLRIGNHQSAAIVGVLSLSLWPVAVGAQVGMPGSALYRQSEVIRPSAPATGTFAPLPMFRPPQSSPYFGSPGGLRPMDHPIFPGMGGFMGGGFYGGVGAGSPLNRSDVNFNSLFGRAPYGLNSYESPFAPGPERNPGYHNNSPLPPSYFSQAPGVTPETRHYSARASQPIINNGTNYNQYGHGYYIDNRHHLHHLAGAGWDIYFPSGLAYYPSYYRDYAYGLTVASPYYYYGTFPPYIGATTVYEQPPAYAFVPSPTYTPDG